MAATCECLVVCSLMARSSEDHADRANPPCVRLGVSERGQLQNYG